jgi:nicotinamidase-related amidase
MSVASGLVRDGAQLVVIDMQRVFAEASSQWATPAFEQAAAGIRRLAEPFRNRTVFTRFVPGAPPLGAWVEYYEQWPFALEQRDADIFDLVPEFAAVADATVDCPTFSKWAALRERLGDADQIVLTGVSTDCCVIATALAAADGGMRVLVAADACAGLSPEDHDRALAAMALFPPHIVVATIDEILASASE